MAGMVSDVSATSVLTTHRRAPTGGGANTRACFAELSIEYRGSTHRGCLQDLISGARVSSSASVTKELKKVTGCTVCGTRSDFAEFVKVVHVK
jgi:hypothetical protein